MEDDHGMTSPSNLSSRGAGSQMSPSNSETSESRCMRHVGTFPCTCVVLPWFNPLSPNSDQHQFSPNNIHTMSRD